jgi:hypothetical protein
MSHSHRIPSWKFVESKLWNKLFRSSSSLLTNKMELSQVPKFKTNELMLVQSIGLFLNIFILRVNARMEEEVTLVTLFLIGRVT